MVACKYNMACVSVGGLQSFDLIIILNHLITSVTCLRGVSAILSNPIRQLFLVLSSSGNTKRERNDVVIVIVIMAAS